MTAAKGKRIPRGLLVVVVVCGLGMLVPIFYVAATAIDLGWHGLAPLIFRPRVGELVVNTALLLLVGVPLTVALGVGGAWLVERTDLPGRRFFAVLLVAPLAIPAFVSSYAWASVVPSISGLGGGLLIATLAYYPLVYLPALATLRGLDPALEEAARALGHGSTSVFFRVLLPQLRLAILGGGLLVALHLLAEYGAFAFIRFDTFTTAIVVAFQSTFAGPSASSLGVVLATLCLVLLLVEARARGRASFARVGSGSPHPPVAVRLGRAKVAALAALTALGLAAVVVPASSVVRWLATSDLADLGELPGAVAQTVGLAGAGAVAAVLIAVPIAWLTVKYPSGLSRAIESPYYVASSLPAIIVALALVTVTLRFVPGIYQSVITVVAAYVVIFLPRALVSLRAVIAQIPDSLEQAARSLGVSPLEAKLRVVVPLMAPGLAAGAALVALGAANELTATLLLAPTGTRTLATQFWSSASAIDYPGAAPYAALLICLSAPAVALMFRQARSR